MKGQRGGFPRGVALFDLESDIAEQNNVIADHPEIAQQLRERAAAFQKEMLENIRPAGLVKNPKALTMPQK